MAGDCCCGAPPLPLAPVALFDWGAAACLPFRPRLRYRRSILIPARWRIPAGALPGPAAPRHAWAAAMAVLLRQLRLPASVFVGTADRRLRLHLDDPMDLALLRVQLDTASEGACCSPGRRLACSPPAPYSCPDNRAGCYGPSER
ncbi:MAG: lantibiotic dehydratase [Pseudonocardiaceae bacterium]